MSTFEVPYRTLGKTGEKVSAIGLGGWHLGLPTVSEELAVRLIRTALDRGFNFLDNSWDYFNGLSELRMGKALRDGYRKKAFLMTKIDGRSKKEAASQIEQSLLRLQTDTIDLVQHHEVLRFEDPNRIFDEDGAHVAMLEARKAGKIRFIGFTGHKDPHIHLYMLDVARENGFHFDTVQMPLNVMDAHFRSFGKLVVPRLVEEGVGILGMKSMANGIILKSRTVTPIECLHYALSLPTSVVIAGVDSVKILNQAFTALRTFPKFTDADRAALLDRTRKAAAKGKWEPFKTSSIFDGTAATPKWLGEEPPRLQRIMPQ
jgi:aryl-alcohol dehydrogenase-like predicted oxidoreductase